jgi:hypothetical protein
VIASTHDTDRPEFIPPANLLIFLDETGDEGYSGSRHPVFGISGCESSPINAFLMRSFEVDPNPLDRGFPCASRLT